MIQSIEFDTPTPDLYISPMLRPAFFLSLILIASGCSSSKTPSRTPADEQLFGPVSMKLETFTQMKSWTNNARPDGIEAVVEFDDQFGDRTKAAGTITFELYVYRPGWPDPRGAAAVNPWHGSLEDIDQQNAHWERASGAYTFKLAFDGIQVDQDYVLDATFESAGGKRFFSQIIVPAIVKKEHKREHPVEPTTSPDTPGKRIPAP